MASDRKGSDVVMVRTGEAGDFVIGFWCVSLPGVRDCFIFAKRPKGSWNWLIDWRIRLYVDDKTHGSEDLKQFFSREMDGSMSVGDVIKVIKTSIIDLLWNAGFGTEVDESLVMSDDPDKLMEAFKGNENMHILEIETPEQAEDMGYHGVAEKFREMQNRDG